MSYDPWLIYMQVDLYIYSQDSRSDVTLDRKISHKEPISAQLQRIYSKTSAFKRMSRFAPLNAMILQYKTFL